MRVPIHLFSVAEFGIKPHEFSSLLSPVFRSLPPDFYDVKRRRIEILEESPIKTPPSILREYYEGIRGEQSIFKGYKALSTIKRREYHAVEPYRARAVSTFDVSFINGLPIIQRKQTPLFKQEKGLISEDKVDIRLWSRKFEELPKAVAEMPVFQRTLEGVSCRIHSLLPSILGLKMIVHLVKVKTLPNTVTSNSPEGLHQDGFPLIVSALVVERENVSGGESRIYGEDKKDPIFTTVLQPGSGLLQPDLGTPLWHLVTPITGQGYRSTIGFDIEPIIKE